jgi:hypothetical protein
MRNGPILWSACVGILLGGPLGYFLNAVIVKDLPQREPSRSMIDTTAAPESVDVRGLVVAYDRDSKTVSLDVQSLYPESLPLTVSAEGAQWVPHDANTNLNIGAPVRVRIMRNPGQLRAAAIIVRTGD